MATPRDITSEPKYALKGQVKLVINIGIELLSLIIDPM